MGECSHLNVGTDGHVVAGSRVITEEGISTHSGVSSTWHGRRSGTLCECERAHPTPRPRQVGPWGPTTFNNEQTVKPEAVRFDTFALRHRWDPLGAMVRAPSNGLYVSFGGHGVRLAGTWRP